MNQGMLRSSQDVRGINRSEYFDTQPRKESMSLPDKLLLTPIDKFERHNRFPWKMVIHILLVCFTTALVLLVITDVADYRRNLEIMWSSLFLTTDGGYESLDPSKRMYLYNANQLSEFLNTSVGNYYGINEMTLENFELPHYDNGTIQDPEVRVIPLSFENYQSPLEFTITQDNVYPFAQAQTIKKFINQVAEFTISYNFKTRVESEAITNYNCFSWYVTQRMSFASRGFIEVSLDLDTQQCGSSVDKIWRLYDWLHILVIIFAIWSLMLSIRYIYKFSVMFISIKKRYQRARKDKQAEYQERMERIELKNQKLRQRKMLEKYSKRKTLTSPKSSAKLDVQKQPLTIQEEGQDQLQGKRSKVSTFSVASAGSYLRKQTYKTLSEEENQEQATPKLKDLEDDRLIRWEDLQFSDKAALFNKWTIIAIVASFIQILSSVISLAQLDPHIIQYQILIGLGCMLAWINLTRYIEYNRESAIFINTLGRSLPYVGRFLLGVFPIFLGYVFLGLSMFWNSKRFTSTSGAMVTLFAVLNGDMVYDTFHDLGFVNIVLSQIYMYSFVLLFINVVQNVFITIIEDGFISIKYKAEHDQFTNMPVKNEPDFRQINDDNEKSGNVVMGATGNFHHSLFDSAQSGYSEKASSILDIEHQRQKRKEKKKILQYKSKVALYNIISGGRKSLQNRIAPREEKGNLPQWKIGIRTGKAQVSPSISQEESKDDLDMVEMMEISEGTAEWKEKLEKFGDRVVHLVQIVEKKIDENTSAFGKLRVMIDDEIREEFQKQLNRIIEAATRCQR